MSDLPLATHQTNRPGAALFTILVALLLTAAPASALDDPMRPPSFDPGGRVGSAPAGPSGFSLTSTLVSPDRRVAVINGRTLAVGERIGGAEIIEILPDRVRIRRGKKESTLTLAPVNVKEPVSADTQEATQP